MWIEATNTSKLQPQKRLNRQYVDIYTQFTNISYIENDDDHDESPPLPFASLHPEMNQNVISAENKQTEFVYP